MAMTRIGLRAVPRVRLLCLLSALVLSAVFFSPSLAVSEDYSKYSNSFFDAFDTVTTLTGYTADKESFDLAFNHIKSLFFRYHRIYDAYNEYENVKNLWFLNRNASEGYTQVEPELMELLVWLRQAQKETRGRVNIAMGSVLSIWHRCREEGTTVPSRAELEEAALHTDFDRIRLDTENCSVFFDDPGLQIDLGAVAKGYVVEIAAGWLREHMPSFILSAGGNVRCGTSPMDGRDRWGVAISDPDDPSMYMDVLYLTDLSVVTSGDYQRYYTVDGVRYHHIIDPDTLMPADFMRAVTVVTEDSGVADLLSTAFFNLSYEEGRKWADSMEHTEVYWVLKDGTVHMTDGFSRMLRSYGAGSRN